ncbi:uncharacterized protein [Drosophila bipectinata]|uniref:uncharacterized protein n=1 Tax=Drosophila bipectinata TaxID=42026 RepID=UPI0007E88713|nr:uncharacterized protein LOC108132868 [Drosophila bipectinata]KAH8272955.1 hypothetical protein KR026_003097 [Drosophila bipectinata]KAH8322391.1 hypothetical protein KR074_012596 [Drosophila pseudoananassae]
MPFPIHPPKQMPCPHWQHFPISPVDTKPNPFDTVGGAAAAAQASQGNNKPPEPVSYRYCLQCKTSGKEVANGHSSDRE